MEVTKHNFSTLAVRRMINVVLKVHTVNILEQEHDGQMEFLELHSEFQ